MKYNLTKRQKDVLDFIKAFVEENGYAPTYQEIADNSGMKSRSEAYARVQALIKKGHVVNKIGSHRSLTLVE